MQSSLKQHSHQPLVTETFSMNSENLGVINNKTEKIRIGMVSHFYSRIAVFLLRTYLEYVKIAILKSDANSNRRAVANEYLLFYLGVDVFVI